MNRFILKKKKNTSVISVLVLQNIEQLFHTHFLFQIIMAPQLQKPAPQFSGTAVVNGEFKEIKLSDYKGKYVVLFFYPLDL